MWTLAALGIISFIGPIAVRRYERFLNGRGGPWIYQELGSSRTGSSRSTRGGAS